MRVENKVRVFHSKVDSAYLQTLRMTDKATSVLHEPRVQGIFVDVDEYLPLTKETGHDTDLFCHRLNTVP